MIREIPSLQNDTVSIQDHTQSHIKNRNTMDMRRDNRKDMTFRGPTQAPQMMSKQEYFQALSSQNSTRRLITKSSYFSLESMVVLVGLTASLLFLPLILPPLPPPPSMLLLIPIVIMVLLMVLALMPSSNAKHVTTTNYM
ncbi:ARGOS-like protein [Raphanus sativus]|uniref:ARGOS-like protein n=1 Tax=Raphanus sativus TaxID=3726 RepID=A0A9W3CNU6_RAPSA|nr:ARGOS-like protein [Raphanus sativus]KAJ4871887.1 ARGOS-like protein [Raphanus sativus]